MFVSTGSEENLDGKPSEKPISGTHIAIRELGECEHMLKEKLENAIESLEVTTKNAT